MDETPIIGLRKFRETITEIDHPVRVIKTRDDVRMLGVWIPLPDYETMVREQRDGRVIYSFVAKQKTAV